MTATERLARFVYDLDLAALPVPVRDYAKLCIADTLGIALAGHNEPCTQAARAVAQQQNPATPAELEAKFDALAALVLPVAQLQRVKEAFGALEEVSHIGAVVAWLSRQDSQE